MEDATKRERPGSTEDEHDVDPEVRRRQLSEALRRAEREQDLVRVEALEAELEELRRRSDAEG